MTEEGRKGVLGGGTPPSSEPPPTGPLAKSSKAGRARWEIKWDVMVGKGGTFTFFLWWWGTRPGPSKAGGQPAVAT